MRIFLSYPSELKSTAEPIAFSLRSRGHKVFLDRDDLPAGQTYEDQIHDAIEASDLFVCLISPEAVDGGRFTLTELAWARKKWGTADEHVLPVMVKKTDLSAVPNYLKSVTILEPMGNVAAEVTAAVNALVRPPSTGYLAPRLAGICALSGLVSGLAAVATPGTLATPSSLDFALGTGFIINHMKGAPFYVPILFTVALVIGLRRWGNVRVAHPLLLFVLVALGWIAAVNIGLNIPSLLGVDLALEQNDALSEADRAKLNAADSVLRFYAIVVAGFAAGAAGAALTQIGLFRSLAPRREVATTFALTVIFAGGLAGLLLHPALNSTGVFRDTFLPLFVFWQGVIGAALAYAISHSKA